MKENAIILFLKLPSKGKVKTRLGKDLGPDLVLALYKAFINDILNICSTVSADTLIAYAPDSEAEKEYKTLLSKHTSFMQRGCNLGERMFNAFTDAYSRGYKKCVLIGSDIPGITNNIISEACSMLDKYDIAIGPSADGGYYLIGNTIKSNSDQYYKDIEWSRPDVYEKTKNRIELPGYSMSRLATLNDIDDIHDLIEFYETNKNNGLSDSISVIYQNKEFILGEIPDKK